LKKGMTAGVEYQIQLWEKRRGWFDLVIAESLFRMKVGYDNWDRKFVVTRHDGESRFSSDEETGLQCSRLLNFKITHRDRLKPGKWYRILVRVVFQPMSIENVRELKHWLSGEVDDLNAKSIKRSRSPWKSAGDWLLGFIVNVSGFGDREVTASSPELVLENGAVRIKPEE
jgi:hypothetical protein